MGDRNGAGRTFLIPRARKVSSPRLVGTMAIGVLLLTIAALLGSIAAVAAFRLGFVGAVVFLFGATGYVAFWVSRRGQLRRDRT